MTDTTGPGYVLGLIHGDLVKDAGTAVALAEVLVESNFGVSKLEAQRPLVAYENGNFWIVEGSLNKERSVEGPGKLVVKIEKADASILYLGFDYVVISRSSPP
jgi:hypothetical protein